MLRSRDHICESLLSPFPCFIDITDHCLTRVSPPFDLPSRGPIFKLLQIVSTFLYQETCAFRRDNSCPNHSCIHCRPSEFLLTDVIPGARVSNYQFRDG